MKYQVFAENNQWRGVDINIGNGSINFCGKLIGHKIDQKQPMIIILLNKDMPNYDMGWNCQTFLEQREVFKHYIIFNEDELKLTKEDNLFFAFIDEITLLSYDKKEIEQIIKKLEL